MKMNTRWVVMAAVTLLTAPVLRAEDKAVPKVDPLELAKVPNVSLAEEPAELAKNVGKIVRLRFSYRTAKPAGSEDGKTSVEIMHDVIKGSMGKSEVATLVVPSEGSAWLGKVPTKLSYSKSEFVYARVVSNHKVEALGTKIVNGAKGPDLAW